MKRFVMTGVGLLVSAMVVLGQAEGPDLKGEKYTPAAKGERLPDKLKQGGSAPDFALPGASGKKEVRLSSFKGKKPVVLIFGSCT